MERKISPDLSSEIEFELEQSRALQAKRCSNNAPFICYPAGPGQWYLIQGCCNSWLCPRCGQIRAREEYWKIVNGAKMLDEAGEALYFVTITCQGKELDLSKADDDYLLWTNRLLSAWRARTKKQGDTWAYVQVTERQKRGAAHSHMITCSVPADAIEFKENDWLPNGSIAKHDCLYSQWFIDRNVSAGLGKMADITTIRNPIAVAVYVSKYLFKDMQAALFPSKWKRVRYSQSWPKESVASCEGAFPVVRASDWRRVGELPGVVKTRDEVTYERALACLCTNVLPPLIGDSLLSAADTTGRTMDEKIAILVTGDF